MRKVNLISLNTKAFFPKSIVFFFFVFIMGASFTFGYFDRFQWDSEQLVFGKIIANQYGFDTGEYGLGRLESDIEDNDFVENHSISRFNYPYVYEKDLELSKRLNYKPYMSSFGLQGKIFSSLYPLFDYLTRIISFLKPFQVMWILNSLLLSIILVFICLLLIKPFGSAYALIYYLVFLFSPWIISFARNLYWVPFTWFLPMLTGLIILNHIRRYYFYIPLIYFAILLKSLCGYEYITTIMLSSIAFLIIAFFKSTYRQEKKNILLAIFTIGLVSLLAFFSAIVIHSNLRGGTIKEGLSIIFHEDVLRRTLGGDSTNYPEAFRLSIESNIFIVLFRYIFHWTSDVFIGTSGVIIFPLIFIIPLLIFINYYINKEYKLLKDSLILYIVFFLTTISWFVLAKAHSYIHTHMNYVLWYFGFIQSSLFIIIQFIKKNLLYLKIILKKFLEPKSL